MSLDEFVTALYEISTPTLGPRFAGSGAAISVTLVLIGESIAAHPGKQ
jgi:hypothetical protein